MRLALIKVSIFMCLFISIWSYVGQTEQHQNQTRPVSLFHSQHTHRNNCNSQHSVLHVIAVTAPVVFLFFFVVYRTRLCYHDKEYKERNEKIKGHCPVPVFFLFFLLSSGNDRILKSFITE